MKGRKDPLNNTSYYSEGDLRNDLLGVGLGMFCVKYPNTVTKKKIYIRQSDYPYFRGEFYLSGFCSFSE